MSYTSKALRRTMAVRNESSLRILSVEVAKQRAIRFDKR